MRIVNDAAKALGVEPRVLFTRAVANCAKSDSPSELWGYYQRSNTIPSWMVDYLITVILEQKNGVRSFGGDSPCSIRNLARRKEPLASEGEAAA